MIAWVCGRSLVRIGGSNPAEGMDNCVLWVLCVVRWRSLRRADHSWRGVPPIVVCLSVISKPQQWEGLGPIEAVEPRKKLYRGADKSLARAGRKEASVSVRMAWICFGALRCRKRNLMTAPASNLLKSRASVTCFRACFHPGRAKDLSAPGVYPCK